MNWTAPLAVWAFLVAATLAESSLVYNPGVVGSGFVIPIILVLAAVQVGSVGSVYMHLRHEPRGVVLVAVASVFFAVLAVALFLASIGH